MGDVSFSFAGETLHPLTCGALFWPARETLLVADLHLEKGSAFARKGWLLPPHDSVDTLRKLAAAVRLTGARDVVALGDSFHDADGPARLPEAARELLAALLDSTRWLWVTGNHDGESGAALGGQAVPEVRLGGIALRHEAELYKPDVAEPYRSDAAEPDRSGAEISGHFHPKVLLELRTGRRVSRRCLALAGERLVLPAYGAFAGGLFVDDPAFARALGARPEALLALPEGLLRIPAPDKSPLDKDKAA